MFKSTGDCPGHKTAQFAQPLSSPPHGPSMFCAAASASGSAVRAVEPGGSTKWADHSNTTRLSRRDLGGSKASDPGSGSWAPIRRLVRKSERCLFTHKSRGKRQHLAPASRFPGARFSAPWHPARRRRRSRTIFLYCLHEFLPQTLPRSPLPGHDIPLPL